MPQDFKSVLAWKDGELFRMNPKVLTFAHFILFLSLFFIGGKDKKTRNHNIVIENRTLHHKYAIVDYAQGSTTPLLITGSHNWSASANSIHDENTLLIYDHTLANIYYQEFSARFQGFTDATNDVEIDPLEIS